MAIKLEVGKLYELNNGKVHGCTKMSGDDPLAVDHLGYGPFVINDMRYHQDGRWSVYSAEDVLSVKRCVDGEPKLWRYMTPEEKGALLLAHHEGEVIEFFSAEDKSWVECEPMWRNCCCYRVKPEPVRETVTLYGTAKAPWLQSRLKCDTHRITFDVIDGVPDCDSIKMEKLP